MQRSSLLCKTYRAIFSIQSHLSLFPHAFPLKQYPIIKDRMRELCYVHKAQALTRDHRDHSFCACARSLVSLLRLLVCCHSCVPAPETHVSQTCFLKFRLRNNHARRVLRLAGRWARMNLGPKGTTLMENFLLPRVGLTRTTHSP